MGRIDTYPQNAILQPNSPVTLGYAQVTTNQTGVGTSSTDLAGLNVTVAVPEGRRIRITGFGIVQQQTAVGSPIFSIMEGATQLNEEIATPSGFGGVQGFITMEPTVIVTPSAGMHTYKLQLKTTNNTCDLNAGATIPAYILVEDITGMPLPVSPSSVPVGQLGYAEITAPTATLGPSETDIPGLSVNFTVPSGRTIRVTGFTHSRSSVTTDTVYVRLFEDGANRGFAYVNELAASPNTCTVSAVWSPTSGNHTVKLRLARQAGSGNINVYAAAGEPSWLLVEDITGTPAATTGAPSSTLAYAEVTANQVAITSPGPTDLTGLTVTVTVPAGRRIRITGHGQVSYSDTSTGHFIDVLEDGVDIGRIYLGGYIPNTGAFDEMDGSVIRTPAAGNHTYKLSATRYVGAGTATLSAGATNTAFILVEDITASTFTYSQPGVLPVNSSSLPSNPSVGAMVYEVDTGATRIWTGSAWQIFGQGSSSTLGYAEITANSASFTTIADIAGLTTTVVIPAGRRIRVTASGPLATTAGSPNFGTLFIYEGATELAKWTLDTPLAQAEGAIASVILTPSAGTHIYKVSAAMDTGTGVIGANANEKAYILVEDVTGTIPGAPATSVPVGVLGFAENSADQNVTTAVDLTSLSVNVVVPAGRTVRVTGQISVQSSVSGDLIDFFVYDNGVDIKHREWRTTTANVAEAAAIEVILSPSAGAHTYNLRAGRGFSATGTITIIGTSDRKGSIIVEDITPTPTLASVTPSSTLGYAEVTANQGTYTAVTDITGLTLTVIVAAGRRLRISSEAYVQSSVANDGIDWRIQEGATILQNGNITVGAATTVENQSVSVIITPSAGTHTYKITSSRSSGTGNITMVAAAQNPAFILIEDITPTSVNPTAIVPGEIICTSATRPSSPAVGTMIYETDTGLTRVWNGTVWTQQTPLSVTSSTRPASPTSGVEIFETDTGLLKYWNGSNWVTETNLRLFNLSSALAGSPPAIDTGSIGFKIQCGTTVDTTSASGLMTLTFPTAFPNGLITCTVCQGGNTVQDAIFATTGGSASSITIVAIHGNNTVVNGALVRYNWIAIGW